MTSTEKPQTEILGPEVVEYREGAPTRRADPLSARVVRRDGVVQPFVVRFGAAAVGDRPERLPGPAERPHDPLRETRHHRRPELLRRHPERRRRLAERPRPQRLSRGIRQRPEEIENHRAHRAIITKPFTGTG
nr:hypothetical protein [Actinoplanes hulinensis]